MSMVSVINLASDQLDSQTRKGPRSWLCVCVPEKTSDADTAAALGCQGCDKLHVTSGLAADCVLARAYHTLKMAYSTIIDSICSNTLTVSLSRLDLVGK